MNLVLHDGSDLPPFVNGFLVFFLVLVFYELGSSRWQRPFTIPSTFLFNLLPSVQIGTWTPRVRDPPRECAAHLFDVVVKFCRGGGGQQPTHAGVAHTPPGGSCTLDDTRQPPLRCRPACAPSLQEGLQERRCQRQEASCCK